MGKLRIAGIPEPVNMPDEQLKKSVNEIARNGRNGKSTTISGYTDSGAVVTFITPETAFMAEFDDLDLEDFLGIEQSENSEHSGLL